MFEWFLSLIFPQTTYEKVVCDAHSITLHTATVAGGILTCSSDSDNVAHAAVRVLKKTRNTQAGALLATLVYDVLLEEFADTEFFASRPPIIVPMPSSRSRLRERGFNQVAYVCELLPEELSAYVDVTVLIDISHRPMQKTLTRSERLQSVKESFEVTRLLDNEHVILIDDVVTTGATLNEAKRVLEEAGAVVQAVALVRA